MESRTRNCFLSYHHDYDQGYVDELRARCGRMRISDYSLKDDVSYLTEDTIYKMVRERMYLCSITIVLIGPKTGHRKWVDWELWSSLRAYKNHIDPKRSFKPNGLLAIFLPTKHHSVPPRLKDNIDSGYAVTMHWNEVKRHLNERLATAYQNRTEKSDLINNSHPLLERDYINFLGLKV